MYLYIKQHISAVTVTHTHFTEEMQDTVHSLIETHQKQGYYEWKKKNIHRHNIDKIEQVEASQLDQSIVPGDLDLIDEEEKDTL